MRITFLGQENKALDDLRTWLDSKGCPPGDWVDRVHAFSQGRLHVRWDRDDELYCLEEGHDHDDKVPCATLKDVPLILRICLCGACLPESFEIQVSKHMYLAYTVHMGGKLYRSKYPLLNDPDEIVAAIQNLPDTTLMQLMGVHPALDEYIALRFKGDV